MPPRTAQAGTFFITTITYNRRRLFQLPANAEALIATLQHHRREGLYKLHAFIVMPDHVPLLLTPQTKTHSEIMNRIKGGFSHRLASSLPVWQRGFAAPLVQNAHDFETHRTSIHQNPVRARLAPTPELPPFLSRHP